MAADRLDKSSKEYRKQQILKRMQASTEEADRWKKINELKQENAQPNEFRARQNSLSDAERAKGDAARMLNDLDAAKRAEASRKREEEEVLAAPVNSNSTDEEETKKAVLRNAARKRFREGTSNYIKTGVKSDSKR